MSVDGWKRKEGEEMEGASDGGRSDKERGTDGGREKDWEGESE